jgi:plastocyanin
MNSIRLVRNSVTVLLVLLGGLFLVSSRTLGQEASPARPSHIHDGDCDELGQIIQPLTALTVPVGQVSGNKDAVVAEAAFTVIPLSLDELLATDHALKVHLSKEQIQIYLACGDIGGTVDANGALIVGMKELDNSGYTGIAYLAPAGDGGTSVSVLIAKVLSGGTPEAATEAAQAAAATPAAASEPQLVDVSVTEFTIDMPTTLSAGKVRFNVTNNGAVPHSFVLEGEGISKRLANNVPPGGSAKLNADLKPGAYTVYCPVGEGAHRAKGMEVTLTVT